MLSAIFKFNSAQTGKQTNQSDGTVHPSPLGYTKLPVVINIVEPRDMVALRHSKGFKKGILALFLTSLWTLNSGLTGQTRGMEAAKLHVEVDRNTSAHFPQLRLLPHRSPPPVARRFHSHDGLETTRPTESLNSTQLAHHSIAISMRCATARSQCTIKYSMPTHSSITSTASTS